MRCANLLAGLALALSPIALVAAQESPSAEEPTSVEDSAAAARDSTSSTSTETLTLTLSRVVATSTVTTLNPETTESTSSTTTEASSSLVDDDDDDDDDAAAVNTTTTSHTVDYTSQVYSAPSGTPSDSANGTSVATPTGNSTSPTSVLPAGNAAASILGGGGGGGILAASLMGLLTLVLSDVL
ncbi:MAG: hypothetical protein M1815_001756 [Lichina confinis]|nr:MAG: hypothetical protein M1815_001756 [Lichina confinis]